MSECIDQSETLSSTWNVDIIRVVESQLQIHSISVISRVYITANDGTKTLSVSNI